MTTHPPTRRAGALLTGLVVLAAGLTLPGTTASAAEGSAPAPADRRVLQKVHTDAVSTFLDDGVLTLGTRADLPEGNGTRLDPSSTVFNVDDASLRTVPAGYEFLAPAGAEVWIAPETNPAGGSGYAELWPGFSTESPPPGAVDADTTTLTLTDVEAPEGASVEVWRGAGTGLTRMWSSDDGPRSFALPRTHMHASWAFTAPGTYELGVRADASVGGQPVSATSTYTFVVGAVPEPVATTTTLTQVPTDVVAGATVTLAAAVAPADARGWVEMLDGSTVLGHAAVTDGSAALTVPGLPLGERQVTARYVPERSFEHATSTSSPRKVTVRETDGGETFAVTGVAPGYSSGDVLTARLAGVTLGQGQSVRWTIQPVGGGTEYVLTDVDGGTAAAGVLVRPLTTSYDGHRIRASLRGPGPDGRVVTLQQTGWVDLHVAGPDLGSGEAVTVTPTSTPAYAGDVLELAVDHRPLADGETLGWAVRNARSSVDWWPEAPVETVDGQHLLDPGAILDQELVARVVAADGTVLGTSAPVTFAVPHRELNLAGLQTVYRPGDTLRVEASVFPARDGLVYTWWLNTADGAYTEIEDATGPVLELPLDLSHEKARINLTVSEDRIGGIVAFNRQPLEVRVTEAAPDTQLLLFSSLSGHYHQGDTVRLSITAVPGLAPDDEVTWEWRRADQQDFSPVPGATGLTHTVVAEQALDGTQVRAAVRTADGEPLADAEPVTVRVDDHGAPVRQTVTVSGAAASYPDGSPVELSASVAPASVVDRYEWYVQEDGSAEPTLAGTGATLRTTATPALDGASVVARLVLDDGTVYAASAAVRLAVTEAEGPAPTDPTEPVEPVEPTDPVDPGTPSIPVDPGTPPAPVDPALPGVPGPPTTPSDPDVAGQAPSEAPAPRDGSALDGSPAGGIAVDRTRVAPGEPLTIDVGRERAGTWVAAWMFSEPVLLEGGWVQVSAAGAVSVTVPSSAPAGTHRIAVFDAAGELVGWQAVEVTGSGAPAAPSGVAAGGALSQTGASASSAAVVAVLLVLAGAAVLVAARRRSSTQQRLG